MNFSVTANHDPAQESLRLSVMFCLFLMGSGIVWFILRRTVQNPTESSPRTVSQRLRRLLLIGAVSLICFGSGALVYYSEGTPENVLVASGNPMAVAFLPISQWGFGVSGLAITDQRSDRESSCASVIEGVRFRFGFLEYRQFEWPPPCVA